MKASTANIKKIYIERNMTCHPTPKTQKNSPNIHTRNGMTKRALKSEFGTYT
jgi:hypothetical protein